MADTSYYAKKKEESDKKIQAALAARKARTEAAASSLATKKAESDKKIQSALNTRSVRLASSLPTILNDMQSEIDRYISDYNQAGSPYGTYEQIRDPYREKILGIKKMQNRVEAYRSYIGDEAADGALSTLEQLYNGYNYQLQLSQYESEDDYNTAVRHSGYYQKYYGKGYDYIMTALGNLEDGEEKDWLSTNRYEMMKTDTEFATYADTGWAKYLHDEETAKRNKQEEYDSLEWWEKIFYHMGASPDTSLPMGTTSQVVNDRRNDASYLKPADDWTDEQRRMYGYLYSHDTASPGLYAQSTTEANNQAENAKKIAAIEEWSTKNGWNMALATAGNLLLTPYSLVDTLGALTTPSDRGLSTSATPLPGQVSMTITNAIASTLNGVDDEGVAHNVINENIPIIGGKGWGDVYQLGTSIANSLYSGYTQGSLGTYMVFFGSASAQGIYDAKNRGATDNQAITLGILNGLAEAAGEALSVEHLLNLGSKEMASLFMKILTQAGVEASEEGVTTLLNNFSDQLVMGDKSNFNILVNQYMAEEGLSESEAKKKAWKSMANDLAFDMVSGAISGGVSSGLQTGVQTMFVDYAENKRAQSIYGADAGALVGEALEIDPDNSFAQKMQDRLDSGKQLSGRQLNRLVQQNENALTAQDMSSIQSAAEARLTELGETGNVAVIAAALTKQATGEKLSRNEQQIISNSKYGQRVSNELNTKNIAAGEYSSKWAESIGTERINAEEYSRLVEAAQQPHETAETTRGQVAADVPKVAQSQQTGPVVEAEAPAETIRENQTVQPQPATTSPKETVPANDQQMTGKLTGKESLQAAEKSTETDEPKAKTVTLEDASKKYGAQAQAMIHTYVEGQDVAKYDQGYQAAYDMGKAGVTFSYIEKSEAVSYLTDRQKQLAYEAGQAASETAAKELDAKHKAAANGKTGRKKGVVRGEGVTISDLKQTFNDTQGKAYKYLSAVAEVTGIDIVLYRSEAGPDGKFQGAQGRYRRSEPGTVYIDLNAGLSDIKSADDLAKYAMLRTFTHEFTHFIENWNPIQYNELRKVVFDTLTERGENVHDLIEDKQAHNPGMSYDNASREVVAEAMTDILPDSNFVQELAEKHKTVFQKLLEKLTEFVANLRNYFNSIGHNRSREANALKEQVGETVKYIDSIVKLFDQVAVQAVENYQLTVAVDAVTGETTVVEAKAEPVVEETTTAVEVSQEIPFDKRTLTLLKSANRIGVVDLDGQKYVTNGSVMLSTTSAGFKYAHVELNATTMNAEVVRKTFENATVLVTNAPMEGKAGLDTVYIFDVGGKKMYFNKKLFSHIDGGLLYTGQYNGGGIIKSVNEDGSVRGYLLGMKFKAGARVTDQKPSKLKSFSNKMQTLIDAQSAPATNPVESVIEQRAPEGVGEWSDIYERLKNPLHGMNKFVTGGYVFGVQFTPGAGYVGSIKQHSDGYVSNARGMEYTSNVFSNRNDAIQDIVTVARNNRLLDTSVPADTVTKAPESVPKPTKTVTQQHETVSKQAESGTNTASEKLAAKLLESYLTEENINRGGKVLTSKELYALADEAFGGTQAEGAYNRKDAYDAMELAVNKFLLQYAAKANKTFNGTAKSAVSAVEFMQDMLELLPTQNVRTQEMEDFQQFSTPPNIAYLAAWAANITGKDMVLEPSAGIGGLAVFAKAWGAEVAVNELSKRRLEVLRAMGFDHLFNENAEQIDNILPESVSPSVVIMNPPFSSTAGRTAHNKTSNAEKHIDQALARLRDGGRLVAVLGKSMNDQDYYRYWDKLRKTFNIRANLSIDGSNYKKYGTTWGVQIVVIDKTGPQTGETITGRYTDLTEVPQVLEGIRNDRNHLEENRPAGSRNSFRESVSDGANQQSSVGNTGSDQRTDGSSTDSQRKKNRKGTDGDSRVGDRTNGKTDAKAGDSQTERKDGGRDRVAGRTDIGDGNGTAEPSRADRPQPEQPLSQLTEQENVSDDGVYATFVAPDIPVKGGKRHPAVLVESAAMAAVSMPKATYKPSLPVDVVKNNLSDAQLVTVTYAGQAHEQKLPDGRRKGFFVGDGTGVGKGRQIAGIILDNFMQGRTKAVWISKNNDLYGDAIRDWTATTGRSKDEVVNHSKIKPKDKISMQDGILYSTYDTIKSEKGGSRLDQIVEWLGKDFDGVIAFDEAHNMGNLFGKKGKFGKSKGSEKARAGVELQRRLPNARIVYVSATAATEVDNLAYAERIGLWGQGTAFSTAQDFISKIGASGLAAMELVIRDMKAMGTYVARSISYNGVNYDTVEHSLDPMQTEIYNTMSRAWQKTMSNVQSALETTGGQYNSTERQKALGNFYSAMQRFYNQVLTSMSMPSVIADMRKELAAGHSCVLQIVNTNEAQQNKQLAEAKANGESLDNLDLTPREALVGYLATSFPTQMFEEYTDDDGNLRSRPVMDSAGNPVQNKAAIRQRDALIEEVNQMSIPDGPLEMLFDAFGPDAVAENTGRSRRVVPRKQADGTITRVEERRTLNHRTADVQAFQDGKKRILVFSDAGGTGKSYHADRTEKNQQLRIHYVLQPGWVASNAVQGFGRTHRSNEASAPIYKLVTTNIKGQKRFTSTIARRLDQLGALTKGQRDTGSGMFGAKDNLETDLAKDSLREFYKRLGKNQIEGIDGMKTLDRLGLKQKFTDEYGAFKINDNVARDISTFLNRILALEVDEQNVVFDAFISIYEMELEAAIQSGTLDTGMENVKADRIEVVDDKVIRQDKNTGASTHYIQAKTYTKPKVVTTVAEMEQRRTGFEGIYRTETGAIKAVYRIADKTTEWGAIQKQYRLVGPNQGARNSVWGEMTLKEKAQAIDKADWQKEWDAEVARVPQYNEDTLHMLTGALLPIWNSLPQEGNTKVKRLIAHDGSTYLGRVIDRDLIDGVLKGFDIGRTMEVFTAKQVMDKALDNGIRFYLTNDKVQIFRSRVSGEWRLEIVQPYNSWYLTRRYPGIIQERISFRDRYFIPVGEKGIAILDKLLSDNPVRNTTDDAEQYQSRSYLEGRSSYVNISQQEWRQIQEDRMTKYGAHFDEMPVIDFTHAHDILYVFENFDETHFGVLERIDPAKNKTKADIIVEVFNDGPVRDIQDYRGRFTRMRNFQKLRAVYHSSSRNRGTGAGNAGLAIGAGGASDRNGMPGTSSSNQDDLNEQHQSRAYLDEDREPAPVFYSQMAKVIDGVKLGRLEAASVVNLLRGKGVKADEIKWSGIETFLDGKKSVTKAELQEFIAGSMLQIEEQTSGTATFIADDGNTYESEAAFKDAAFAIAEARGIDRSRVRFVIDTEYDMDAYAYVGAWNNTILTAEVSEAEGTSPRFSHYKLDGGTNYREFVFQLPDNSYSNQAMRVHWGDDAGGILAHARIQDFDMDGKKLLFIEEIQSDYHNEGHQSGYADSKIEAEIDRLKAIADERFFAMEDYSVELTGLAGEREAMERTVEGSRLLLEYLEAQNAYDSAMNEYVKKIPDAPFRDTYHEYVLKRLLREAAEKGYDSIGWTTAQTQSERWSEEYAEGYRIEYDQDIPKFLNKYGKKWGTHVTKDKIGNDTIWVMNITDSMRESVIYQGQAQFQQRTNTLTDREVLAMAANQVKVDDLTADEKNALDIFQQRLSKLEELQDERAEQGRLYKEQQFGANVDRAASSETLNRMHVLDGQIQRASAEVLSVEEKTVLRRVLQKARAVVEKQEREHGQEILKRWRDRRNNAEAIKKYRDRIRGDVDELTNWVLHPDNKSVVKHIPDALKSTVIPFLSSINFMSKRSLKGGNATAGDKAFMDQLRRLAKVMENTVEVDEMYSNYNDLPPDFMKNLRSFMDTAQQIVDNSNGEYIINQMTSEELQKLSKVVRTLKKYIMTMNRFHVNAMFKHVHDAGDNSIHFLSLLKPAEHTGGISNFVLWQQMRPAYVFERFGEGGMAIYDGLRRGQATLAFNTKKIMEFSEKAYTTAEVKAWDNQVKTIRLGDGRTIKMRVSQIMSLYELSKREQAKGHIFGEGIRVATFKSGKKKISDIGQTITPEELNTILQTLTPRQKEVADKLQQFMEKQGGEWGNYVTVARFGEKQFGEKNYFPINSDGRHLQVDADEKPGASALYALLNMSFTKQTQEKAKNRLIVYSIFDVFANHMASMAQYNAFALPVVDALKWFNYQQIAVEEDGSKTILGSVREQMDRAFGVPEENKPGSGKRGYAQNFVINIIKAFNGTEAQGTAYDSVGLKTLHRYNLAQVAYNLRVVVQQPLAITRAAQLIDYRSIIKGMKLNPVAIKRNIAEMRKYSGIAAWKSLGFYDVNISRGLTSIIKHDDTALDKITDIGMWGAEKADTLTWAAMWSACKEEVIRKQKLTPKSDGFYEAVTKLFEDVIYKTQVVDSVLTKNEFMRDKGFFARTVGSFMSEPTTTASMLVDAYDKYHMDRQRGLTRQQAWKKNGKMIARTAYVYGIGALLLAAAQAVADAFRDDDEYQEWHEKWLEAFGGNLVDELMPFNKLPILSDFYDLAKELLSVFGVDTYGNPPQSVIMQWYDSLVKGTEIIYGRITGEEDRYTWYGGIYKLLQAASGITGLPMGTATREIITAWNNIVGAMAPSLKVKTYDSGEMNEIKYAYQDGYLTDEEATALLLEKGLVDTEDEAYFTIRGWDVGEGYSRYDALYDAVRNGGNIDAAMDELTSHGYKEKDVLIQVKSKIGSWYKDGEITKQQAINMLTKYFPDMDSDEITSTVNKWSCKVVTGIAFEDIKDEFMEDNITESRAIDMYVRYGGYSKDKATETVTKWRAEKETGLAYDDIKEAFMDGEISSSDAKNMYITYGGYTEQEASEKVATLAFVKQHPDCDGISYAAIESYQSYCEAYGVPAGTFYDAWKYNSTTHADVDENGESISGSKKVKVLAYIDSLNLTYAQKDSLYYAFGWAASRIYEAPWH